MRTSPLGYPGSSGGSSTCVITCGDSRTESSGAFNPAAEDLGDSPSNPGRSGRFRTRLPAQVAGAEGPPPQRAVRREGREPLRLIHHASTNFIRERVFSTGAPQGHPRRGAPDR